MAFPSLTPAGGRSVTRLLSLAMLGALAGCASSSAGGGGAAPAPAEAAAAADRPVARAPGSDSRVGLKAGLMDAGQATWNIRLVSNTPSPENFLGVTNSDLAFTGKYAIQGNYNGFQVWDVSNPASPVLVRAFLCPASQSDVSVFRNLLFVSAEGTSSRLDCGTQGVRDTVSADRIRGIRIFDISDIADPKYITNVQTCRGSHTHTVVEDPKDPANVYVYISGSAGVRSPNELPGCSRMAPEQDPNSALFRIEVIRVPLANPSQAAIVGYARIFEDLEEAPSHGEAPEDQARARRAAEEARARGGYVVTIQGQELVLPDNFVRGMLDSVVKARGGTGAPTGADSAALRAGIQDLVNRMVGGGGGGGGARRGPSQCHDITVYPEIGLAGGACGGYGLLLDISDVANPRRIDAVADSNFAFWHSATFNNAGTAVVFTDEWGGGGGPKCRATDKPEWGANAIFTVSGRRMQFQSYYKMPAAQTEFENCVAHNGSLIPVPGRDIMVQGWYQGGVSVFDWTDPAHPKEIAFFDRGPANATRLSSAGSWSAYWYNGYIYSSEIARGLDILDLVPSDFLTRSEIEAAKLVRLEYFNAQGQPKFTWPAAFPVARAYLDQLDRSRGLTGSLASDARKRLDEAERATGQAQTDKLDELRAWLRFVTRSNARTDADWARVESLREVVAGLR